MDEQLLSEFSAFDFNPSIPVLDKCLELMNKYKIDGETIVNCWLGYSTTKLNGAAPTLEDLPAFDREFLSKEKFAKTAKEEPLSDSPVIHNITTINQLVDDEELLGGYGTPVRKVNIAQKYGDVLRYLTGGERNGCSLLPLVQQYMFSRLRDKYEVLEEQIDDKAQLLAEIMKIDEWSPHNQLLSETFNTVGRICCDATSSGTTRLHSSSLLLEGSRKLASGHSVPLDVSGVKEYSFFPGQVVAIAGSNPTGKRVIVSAVTTPPVNPIPKVDVNFQGPLDVIVACGPFTLCDDLEFAPMKDLIERIENIKPQLVILLGPFLDIRNKMVDSFELDKTYQEQFDLILENLQRAISDSIQVLIIPSWRDAHHRIVYPTPPFQPKKIQANFHFFSDPCVVDVDGVLIGLTSTDILFHLSKEEIAAAPQGSDRLGRLVSHLFSQQSFYPLCPASDEMSVDLEKAQDHCKLPFTPHILIVPSDLRFFIKNVNGCVVVNTERTVKGVSGGTFARLQITAGDSSPNSVQVKAEISRV
uniref:DNA polymerase alpha subunit B n=1 Tax=Eubosmina coregoni TaxID=186181 RepID=A0A4Y7LL76_9CRUS|nr:EOG090X07VJ [Eubosmina coregoni]SVE69858.1 EOG090X07VJ [Eubosmina coregoni]